MLKTEDEQLLKGQDLLFDIVLDPSVQAAFNSKKGGIPVRYGVDPETLDKCARNIYKSWISRSGSSSIVMPDTKSRIRLSFVQNTLYKAWTHNLTAEVAAEELIMLVDEFVSRSVIKK